MYIRNYMYIYICVYAQYLCVYVSSTIVYNLDVDDYPSTRSMDITYQVSFNIPTGKLSSIYHYLPVSTDKWHMLVPCDEAKESGMSPEGRFILMITDVRWLFQSKPSCRFSNHIKCQALNGAP